ncbi:MAG: HEPN domain-containing protein [Candidatus Aenigmarchaeota archaeon]|nr:HEPN domain-containing protein [Candidatus Aenigmarchaeota archaeon]
MKRVDVLKRRIERYLGTGQLLKSQEYSNLERPYLKKSRKNFTVANVLFRISENDDFRKVLSLASDFHMYDWVIVVSYYSMYTSSLAAISRLCFTSKSHAATIALLERFYVEENRMPQQHLHNLTRARALSEDLITKLIRTKTKREAAQYDATPAISRENALSALGDADEFISKVEEILAT